MYFKNIQNIEQLLKKIAEGVSVPPTEEEESLYERREKQREVYEQPSKMEEEIREQEQHKELKEKEEKEIVEMPSSEIIKPQEVITDINNLKDAYYKVYKYLIAKKDLFGKAETAIQAASIVEKTATILLSKIESLLASIYNFGTTENVNNLIKHNFPQEYANALTEQFDILRNTLSSKAEAFRYYTIAPSEDFETLKELLNDIKDLNDTYRIFKEALSNTVKTFQKGAA